MKSKLNVQQIQVMKDELAVELAECLMRDFHCDLPKALDILYTSDTFDRLQDNETGLYYQSAGYVYSFLQNELMAAKVM